MKKTFLFLALILSAFFAFSVFADEDKSEKKIEVTYADPLHPQAEELLAGWFKNSLDLHDLSCSVEKSILSKDSSYISNGISFEISSGNIVFQFGDEPYISFTPSAEISLPQIDNLKIGLTSSFDISADKSEKTVSETSLSLGADIIGNTMETRKIALLKAERSLLEAQRALQNGFLSAETEFYTTLKSLYLTAAKIVDAQKDLYEDKLSFEEIKASGYASTSSKYRLAQMAVMSDEREVAVNQHELERETKIFASKCGLEYTGNDALDFLPSVIPEKEAVDVCSLSQDNFAETESAVWTHYINGLEREADKAFTLAGSLGYTFDKEIKNEYKDTLDASLSLDVLNSGLSVNGGISLPIKDFNPVYSLGFSLDPNRFRLAKIEDRMDEVDSSRENVAIESSKNNYQTAVIAQMSELSDILWSTKTDAEGLEMYTQLEKDQQGYFDRGLITESELRTVQVNKENYRIQSIIDKLNLIIYNNETLSMFTRDEELKK